MPAGQMQSQTSSMPDFTCRRSGKRAFGAGADKDGEACAATKQNVPQWDLRHGCGRPMHI